MKVWEVMLRTDIYVEPEEKLLRAKEIMRRTGLRCLPVAVEERVGMAGFRVKLLGFLTRVDVIKVTSLTSDARVRDFMREHPVLFEDMDVTEAVRVLEEFGLKAAPVVKSAEDDTYTGILSITDILRGLLAAGYLPRANTVSEVLSKEYHWCTPDERINRIWSKFINEEAEAFLVMRGERLWGIITPKDLIDQRAWMFHKEAERHIHTPGKVKSFMTRGVIATSPDMPINRVAEFLAEHDFTLLPVVDEEGRILGVVRQEDVLYAYLKGRKPEAVPVPVVKPPIPVEVEYVSAGGALRQVLVEREKPIEAAPPITLRDCLAPFAYTVSVKDSIAHAKNVMLRHKVNHLLVVDEKGNIVGVVSKRNILRAIGKRGPIWRRKAADPLFIEYVTTPSPPVLSPNATVEEAAATMVYHDVDVVLVKEDGKLLGIVTKDELAKVFAEKYAGRALVENLMHPRRRGIVHPHSSFAHVVRLMENYYLDAVVVAEGDKPLGLITESKMVFVPVEDRFGGFRRRRLVWVRKLEYGGRKMGRYVKITPLVAEDFMVPAPPSVSSKMDAAEAVKLMLNHGVDGLPVVDDGRLIGVFTKSDVVRELARGAEVPVEERMERAVRKASKKS